MNVPVRLLGSTGILVPPLGFGAFKIGRNQGIKYPQGYELPDDAAVSRLLNSILDLGCTLIDTAPAYGTSEERIGTSIGHRRSEYVLSTKVGETFSDGTSTYDFSRSGVEASLTRSLKRLQTDWLDLVFVHSPGNDLAVQQETDVVDVLQRWKAQGTIRAIGLSGKTPAGAIAALDWADVLMIEYHAQDTTHAAVIDEAAQCGCGVFIKKGLASGQLEPRTAIPFALAPAGVSSLILGGLNFRHFADNWATALQARSSTADQPRTSSGLLSEESC